VELGANCTVDRGVTGDTTIGYGSKIDNQVQIGHDTVLGKHVLIASQTGIAGCVVVEDEVTIWGQVGITSGITIGKKAVISAKSGVSKSLEGNNHYFGVPADKFRSKYKEIASIKKIPEILDLLKKLEKSS
jgi:UDP-3-O-[3-hydroxymyristoyl] glucosamine N-acyltransferase